MPQIVPDLFVVQVGEKVETRMIANGPLKKRIEQFVKEGKESAL
ncbi:hypothetical protein [Bacillus smithii]